MAREVFISYRKEDKPAADRICQALEEANIKCWIAPRDVPIGREWAVSIVEAIKNCSSFVLVLSASSKNAKQIAREAELADNAGLPIITVRVEDVQPPPELQYFLGNVQWLDAFESNFDPAMRRLLEVVRQRAESPAQLRDAPAESVTREPRAQAAAAAASAQAGPGFAQGVPLSQPPKPSGVSESVPAGYPEPAPPRRVLSPYVLAGALVLLVALGIGIWWARRPAPVPAPTPVADTTGAAAFGIGYMQKRDSGQAAAAYDMTGPTFRKHWSGDNFAAAVAALDGRQGRAAKYDSQGTCTERERGAFTCEYLVSYADGSLKKHALVIAKHTGNWVIASDSALGTR